MAKETKIGLIVGMGFIVCFAIVLSHTGQPGSHDPQAIQMNGDRVDRPIVPVESQPDARTLSRLSQSDRARHAQERSGDSRRRNTPKRGAPPNAQGDAANQSRPPDRPITSFRPKISPRPDPLQNPESEDRFTARTDSVPTQSGEVIRGERASEQSLEAAPVLSWPGEDESLTLNLPTRRAEQEPDSQPVAPHARSGAPIAENRKLPGEGNRRQNRSPSADPGERPASTQSTEQDERLKTRVIHYEVKPNDTLSKIARQFYGSATAENLDALIAANGKRIKSPDRLLAGWALVIPDAHLPEEATLVVPPTQGQQPSPTVVSTRRGTEYDVKPGDMLSRIAIEHYGTSRGEVLKAIVAANRDVLGDPDHLLHGTTIVLPTLESSNPTAAVELRARSSLRATPADRSIAARRAVDESKPDEKKWQWYEVQEGEFFSTIAADQLGSSRRWPELASLNRDIFPDPDQIRHGVRIRIPVTDDDARLASRTLSQR